MQSTAYHWVITLQWPSGLFTADGVTRPAPGITRAQLYTAVRTEMAEDFRRRDRSLVGEPVVVFFSLEPDEVLSPQVPGEPCSGGER